MASQLQPGSSSTGSTPAPLAGLGARGGRLARAVASCPKTTVCDTLIGYARVSKTDGSQSLDLQREGNRYHDFASGVRDDRPGLDRCWDDGQPSTVAEHMPSAHRAPGRPVPAPAPDRRARRPRLRGTLRPPRRRRVDGPRAAQAPAAAPRRQAAPSGDARRRRLHPPASAQPTAGPDPSAPAPGSPSVTTCS